MFFVDLKQSDRDITQFITVRCLSFGNVKSVKIHRDPKPFALIEMTTREGALELAAHYDRTMFGNGVLLYLEQENQSATMPPKVTLETTNEQTLANLSSWLV